jgi:hypothetical protein
MFLTMHGVTKTVDSKPWNLSPEKDMTLSLGERKDSRFCKYIYSVEL